MCAIIKPEILMMHNLLTTGRYSELLDYCSLILDKDPLNLDALKYKTYSFYFLRKYNKAILCYDKLIKLEPSNPSHYAGKSKTLEKMHKFAEAKTCYEQARNIRDALPNLGHNKNEWGFARTIKKCEECSKELENPLSTHCSDKCLFETVKNSKKFVSKSSKKAVKPSGSKITHNYSYFGNKRKHQKRLFFEAYDVRWNKE